MNEKEILDYLGSEESKKKFNEKLLFTPVEELKEILDKLINMRMDPNRKYSPNQKEELRIYSHNVDGLLTEILNFDPKNP